MKPYASIIQLSLESFSIINFGRYDGSCMDGKLEQTGFSFKEIYTRTARDKLWDQHEHFLAMKLVNDMKPDTNSQT